MASQLLENNPSFAESAKLWFAQSIETMAYLALDLNSIELESQFREKQIPISQFGLAHSDGHCNFQSGQFLQVYVTDDWSKVRSGKWVKQSDTSTWHRSDLKSLDAEYIHRSEIARFIHTVIAVSNKTASTKLAVRDMKLYLKWFKTININIASHDIIDTQKIAMEHSNVRSYRREFVVHSIHGAFYTLMLLQRQVKHLTMLDNAARILQHRSNSSIANGPVGLTANQEERLQTHQPQRSDRLLNALDLAGWHLDDGDQVDRALSSPDPSKYFVALNLETLSHAPPCPQTPRAVSCTMAPIEPAVSMEIEWPQGVVDSKSYNSGCIAQVTLSQFDNVLPNQIARQTNTGNAANFYSQNPVSYSTNFVYPNMTWSSENQAASKQQWNQDQTQYQYGYNYQFQHSLHGQTPSQSQLGYHLPHQLYHPQTQIHNHTQFPYGRPIFCQNRYNYRQRNYYGNNTSYHEHITNGAVSNYTFQSPTSAPNTQSNTTYQKPLSQHWYRDQNQASDQDLYQNYRQRSRHNVIHARHRITMMENKNGINARQGTGNGALSIAGPSSLSARMNSTAVSFTPSTSIQNNVATNSDIASEAVLEPTESTSETLNSASGSTSPDPATLLVRQHSTPVRLPTPSLQSSDSPSVSPNSSSEDSVFSDPPILLVRRATTPTRIPIRRRTDTPSKSSNFETLDSTSDDRGSIQPNNSEVPPTPPEILRLCDPAIISVSRAPPLFPRRQ